MSDDECECGHVRDEHGDETGLYPNATPCQVEDCRCINFDRCVNFDGQPTGTETR